MLRCADGTLYTGIALDVEQRIHAHTHGSVGAKYLRGRAPLELVFEHRVGTRSAASVVEYRIKRWTKSKKERLLRAPAELRRLIDDAKGEAA